MQNDELRPRPYDLKRVDELYRLLREAKGYLYTCRREHHGTDWEGRRHAIDALEVLVLNLDVLPTLFARPSQPEPEGGLVERIDREIGEQQMKARGFSKEYRGSYDRIVQLLTDCKAALASRPSPNGKRSERLKQLADMNKMALVTTCYEAEAKLATLRKLAEDLYLDVHPGYTSAKAFRAAFPTPTAEEKENG